MTTTEPTVTPPDERGTVELPISGSVSRERPRGGRWRVSLAARLALWYGGILVVTLAAVVFLAVRLTESHLEERIDRRLLATVRSFEEGPAQRVATVDDLEREARSWLASHAFPEDEVEAVRIGSRVLTSVGGVDIDEVPRRRELLTAGESRWWLLEAPETSFRALTVPLFVDGSQEGTLVVVSSREEIADTIDGLVLAIGWAGGVGVVIAAILAIAVARRVLEPFRRILATVEEIEGGEDLSRRVGYRGPPDELGRLADAFDRMLERIEDAFLSQRRFISDASHELRTPLAVVRGQLELLRDRLSEVPLQGRTDVALEELDRMQRIVEGLLLLARLDEGMELELRPVEVELVMREAALRSLQLGDREVTIWAEPDLSALADPERLLQVLTNLLRNAVEHTAEASIVLRSRRQNGWTVIEVEDDGGGILPDELPHVFDRMYRGAGSRTRGSGGAGLGLGIVRSLVRAMGGRVEVASTPNEGSTFAIFLQAAGSARRAPHRFETA